VNRRQALAAIAALPLALRPAVAGAARKPPKPRTPPAAGWSDTYSDAF